MGIAISQVTSRIRSVNATDPVPIHWPSAFVGLALAVCLVVGVSWLAAPRHVDRPIAVAAVSAPPPTAIPTPIPPPPITPAPAPVVERVQVANTQGSGVNLRASAGEHGKWLKSMPEGSVLEVIGADEAADGMIWRNVRDASGTTGWMAGQFLRPVQQQQS